MENHDAISYMVEFEIKKILNSKESLIYAACFSEKGDLLSQWRGYADNGKGVSIGFNINTLKDIVLKSEILELRKIEYVPGNNDEISEVVFEYASEMADNVIEVVLSNSTKELFNNPYATDIFSVLTHKSLIQESVFLKHYSFIEEHEWRLILKDELYKYDNWDVLYNLEGASVSENDIYKLFPKAMQFRSVGDDIISFLELNFEPYIEDIISTIVIGPNCKMDENDLNQLLGHFGYQKDEILIIKSKSTYRER